jgi:hypothetical protein
VDVQSLLTLAPLRMPLRQVDRTQSISFVMGIDKKIKLSVKFVFSIFLRIGEKVKNCVWYSFLGVDSHSGYKFTN